ncbi:MAG: tRNA (adenosine(37)-N6)-threonylcarbamoyltransferase complex dimerization subunit type 1 TsaB, partial [Pseudomonadota bacterium]
MTLVLAFDTSAAHCAVAVMGGETVLVHRTEAMTRGQAERLMPLVQDSLLEAGVRASDLAAIGVGTGPGNFTGTRIAVAAGRGLALGLGCPVEGVSAIDAYGAGRDVIVCLPAPRQMVHLGYRGEIVTVAPNAIPPGWGAAVTGPAAGLVAEQSGRDPLPHPDIAPAIAQIAGKRAAPDRP